MKKPHKKKKKSKIKKRKKTNSLNSDSKVSADQEINNHRVGEDGSEKGQMSPTSNGEDPENQEPDETGTDDKKSSITGSDDGYQSASVSLSDGVSASHNILTAVSHNIHRKTKAFMYRRRENIKTFCDIPNENTLKRRNTTVCIPGSYTVESRLWTLDTNNTSRESRLHTLKQAVPPMRIMSPYKDDDPLVLENLKRQMDNRTMQPLSSYSVHVRSRAELLRSSSPKTSVDRSFLKNAADIYKPITPYRLRSLPEIMIKSKQLPSSVNSLPLSMPARDDVGLRVSASAKRPSPAGLLSIKRL